MKRIFKSLRPKTGLTNNCHRCDKFFEDKDVTMLEEGIVCFNCLDSKNPIDVNKMLRAGFQQEDILTIVNIQYTVDEQE